MTRRKGPALLYVDSAGTTHDIAGEAVPDDYERDLCRALIARADDLADQADDEPTPKPRTGLYL